MKIGGGSGIDQAGTRYELQLQLLDAVASTTPDFVYVFDREGRFLYANRRLLEVWGMKLPEVIGRTCRELGYEQWHHDMHMREIAQVIETQRAVKGEVPFKAPLTGHFGIYEYIFTPVFGAEGQVELIAGTTRDVTERKKAQEALFESEQRALLAVETAALGTYERNLLTNEITMNAVCRDILGAADQQPPPDIARRSIHPEDMERVLATVARSFDPTLREVCGAEFRIRRPDGSVRWVSGRGRVLFDNSKQPPQALKFVGVLFDITERKRLESELLRHTAQLEQLVRERTVKLEDAVGELEHFSYTITHDMRAPLRAMRGFAEVLMAECADCLPPDRRELMQRICDAASRMDHLINDALDYSRVVRVELELQPMDLSTVIDGIVRSYPQFQPPHAEIHIESGMPRVLANEAGLTQCFSNLIGNAVKFVEFGKTPQVSISAERRGDYVRVWVKDNGIGISPEYHVKVWEMFQRLNTRYPGTGIGLALVRKVVERLRGNVGVESDVGKGSAFWVELLYATK
ncbi:MAG TPA: PAS domain S-box protein [Candidatus Limnocylindrales bacterium]|nr:PAS domain S-box protein [Candidatus Limnocylindrales bacterium]